jgi:hypothetical protein
MDHESRDDEKQDPPKGGGLHVELARHEHDERQLHQDEEEPRIQAGAATRSLGGMGDGFTRSVARIVHHSPSTKCVLEMSTTARFSAGTWEGGD